jgi:hypothetical protein
MAWTLAKAGVRLAEARAEVLRLCTATDTESIQRCTNLEEECVALAGVVDVYTDIEQLAREMLSLNTWASTLQNQFCSTDSDGPREVGY